ncbi:hypothetical protein HY030_00555 [Candidatus Gottesmanbacteria bacterium]|nr:hypothetical protein [Candidatus Gottesmanbacteria bacterium]
MNPYLDEQNNPHIKVEFFAPDRELADCLIDTRFSGGLALPERFHSKFKDPPIAYQEYELADGSLTTFSIYRCKVKFKAIIKEITLVFTNSSEGLMGREFLNGFKMVLDLKKYQITLE